MNDQIGLRAENPLSGVFCIAGAAWALCSPKPEAHPGLLHAWEAVSIWLLGDIFALYYVALWVNIRHSHATYSGSVAGQDRASVIEVGAESAQTVRPVQSLMSSAERWERISAPGALLT